VLNDIHAPDASAAESYDLRALHSIVSDGYGPADRASRGGTERDIDRALPSIRNTAAAVVGLAEAGAGDNAADTQRGRSAVRESHGLAAAGGADDLVREGQAVGREGDDRTLCQHGCAAQGLQSEGSNDLHDDSPGDAAGGKFLWASRASIFSC